MWKIYIKIELGLLLSVHDMHSFFVAGISGIENVYIQFYSPDVHYTVFFKYFSLV
jgi:hypothetical protein